MSFMFLTCLIPGPKNPKNKIDVYLQPLVDELKKLWDVGVETYDISTGHTFQMKATLMWTINDFPTYGMLSRWTTNGQLACPVCMKQQKDLRLRNGGNSHGSIIIGAFFQGIMLSEEIETHLGKAELLWGSSSLTIWGRTLC